MEVGVSSTESSGRSLLTNALEALRNNNSNKDGREAAKLQIASILTKQVEGGAARAKARTANDPA